MAVLGGDAAGGGRDDRVHRFVRVGNPAHGVVPGVEDGGVQDAPCLWLASDHVQHVCYFLLGEQEGGVSRSVDGRFELSIPPTRKFTIKKTPHHSRLTGRPGLGGNVAQ